MPGVEDISATVDALFNKESIIALVEREFTTLQTRLQDNIRKKRTNDGHNMNAFGAPASTTGGTEQSISIENETSNDGFSVSLLGSSHIGALDVGKSPEELHQEFGSREEFNAAIRNWAFRKWQRYGRSAIQMKKGVDVWNNGTTLYREGGGTEVVRAEVDATVERINEQLTELLDKSLYEYVDTVVMTEDSRPAKIFITPLSKSDTTSAL